MPRPGFDRLAYREPRPSPAIMRALGWANRGVMLPGVLKLDQVDFPAPDEARLRAVIHPGAAAFVAPNHPEFMTDWLIDKEISRRVAPLMAHWASYEVVNIHPVAQWVWLRNNLIANAPGGTGKEYSVRWARAGHGVLLHPEGAPSWHGDRVGTLVPGAAEMALEARRRGPEPVHIAPVVWKYHFRDDVSAALGRAITHIKRALGIASSPRGGLSERFASLQRAVLARSLGREDDTPDSEFFAVQSAHADHLLEDLESRYGRSDGDRPRRIHGLRRAIHSSAKSDAAAARRDRRTLAEVERLGHFTSEHYSGPTLTQEQIAESLTQTRLALVTRGWREALYGVLPVGVAARTVSIRVPEPIAVSTETDSALLVELRGRLQGGLDRLSAEIEPQVAPYRIPNPFESR